MPLTKQWQPEREAVARAARKMAELGLVAGTSGNVSVRLPADGGRELLAITPSGTPFDAMRDADVVVVDFEVEPIEGDLAPSSESLLHVAIYRRRTDVGAVVHTHAVYSTVAAVTGMEVPPIVDEMVVNLGEAVRVSEYAFPGTQELADNVCAALGDRNAAIIRNHGAVGVGRDLREAFDACVLTERVAKIFVFSSLMGRVGTLPKEIVEAEAAIFRMRHRTSPS